jgi:hypothetical protein
LSFSPYASVLILLAGFVTICCGDGLAGRGCTAILFAAESLAVYLNEEMAAGNPAGTQHPGDTEELDAVAKWSVFFCSGSIVLMHTQLSILMGNDVSDVGPIIASFLQGDWIVLLIY